MKEFSSSFLEHLGIQKRNVFKQWLCPHAHIVTNMEEISPNKSKYYDICIECGSTLIEGTLSLSIEETFEVLTNTETSQHAFFIDGHKYYHGKK